MARRFAACFSEQRPKKADDETIGPIVYMRSYQGAYLHPMQLGVEQAYDLFGLQPFDLSRFQPEFRQDRGTVLANARRRPLDARGGMVKTRGRNGLADPADI